MSIDAYTYNVATPDQAKILKEEIITINEEIETAAGGFWLDKDTQAKNCIEKYILDTYPKVIKDANINESQVVGFEWWDHYTTNATNVVDIHFDCDEAESNSKGKVKMLTPLRATVTYLAEPNDAPTAIFGIKQETPEISHVSDNVQNVVYSYPKIGKFLSFDGSYMHGVFPPKKPITRMTLMYNIWGHRLPTKIDHYENSEKYGEAVAAEGSRDRCPYESSNANIQFDIDNMEKETPIFEQTSKETHGVVDIRYHHKYFRAKTHIPFRKNKGENNLIEIECNNEVIKNV